jgi:hypothetical protein
LISRVWICQTFEGLLGSVVSLVPFDVRLFLLVSFIIAVTIHVFVTISTLIVLRI